MTVWLSTPLGPASASIGAQHFVRALQQKDVPVTVQAQLLPSGAGAGDVGAAASAPRDAQGQLLQVQLHAVVRQEGTQAGSPAGPGPLLQVRAAA